jgi:hypothetical protein
MGNYLEQVLRLDASGRHREIASYIGAIKNLPEVPHNVFMMLLEQRYFEAYTLAKLLMVNGVYNPVLSLAQSIGGVLFGNLADAQYGVATLTALIDNATPDQQRLLGREAVHPVIARLVLTSAAVHDPAVALTLLEIYKAGMVEMRTIFDWSLEDRRPDPAEWSRQGRERANLIAWASPPPGAPRRPVRTLVAMRERMFPSRPDSRLFDFGPLIAAAMVEYGWRADFYPMSIINTVNDYTDIIQKCQNEDIDVLFLDDYVVLESSYHGLRDAVLRRLHELRPAMKIVAIHLDPWMVDAATMISTSGPLDGLWAPHPTMPMWDHPALADKMLFMPFPLAGRCAPPKTPLPPKLTFAGGIMGYNWHRAFWVAGRTHGLEMDTILSSHMDDGLSPVESHARYMARLEGTGCSVNFSMRPDLTRLQTARVFETVLAGALLVQEETPEIDSYFIAGEHYLRFETVRDLRAIAKFVAEQPEEAEAIRQRGNAFAREYYSDDKIIGYIDRKLFY